MTRPKQSPRRCGRQARHPDSLVTASTPVRLRQRIHDDFSRVNAAYEVAPPPPPPPPSAIYMCMRALRHHLRHQHSPPPLSATHPRRVHGAAPTLTGVAQQRGAAAAAAPRCGRLLPPLPPDTLLNSAAPASPLPSSASETCVSMGQAPPRRPGSLRGAGTRRAAWGNCMPCAVSTRAGCHKEPTSPSSRNRCHTSSI